MTQVTKDGHCMDVRDENQLAAFVNNGWKIVTGAVKAEAAKPEEAAKAQPETEEKAEPDGMPEEVKTALAKQHRTKEIQDMEYYQLREEMSKLGLPWKGKNAETLRKILIERL